MNHNLHHTFFTQLSYNVVKYINYTIESKKLLFLVCFTGRAIDFYNKYNYDLHDVQFFPNKQNTTVLFCTLIFNLRVKSYFTLFIEYVSRYRYSTSTIHSPYYLFVLTYFDYTYVTTSLYN